jgi:hypothetical protein
MYSSNLTNLKSALLTAVMMAVLAMAGYAIGVGDVFALKTHELVNSGVMALLAGIVSYIKSSITNSAGQSFGIQVK